MDCSPPGPLSMGFSRQEYWSGLPCTPPGDLPSPGMEPMSPALQAHSLPPEAPVRPILRVIRFLSDLHHLSFSELVLHLPPPLMHIRLLRGLPHDFYWEPLPFTLAGSFVEGFTVKILTLPEPSVNTLFGLHSRLKKQRG